MKKVIIISTSLRTGSNSDMFANQFIEGAKAAGHEVEKISLAGKDIKFCKGCLACQKLGKCVIFILFFSITLHLDKQHISNLLYIIVYTDLLHLTI